MRRPNSPRIFGSPNSHDSEPYRPTDTIPGRTDHRRHPRCFFFLPGRAGDRRCCLREAPGGTWCSSCHIVAPSAQAGADTGVPTFTAIASMPSTTPIALRVYPADTARKDAAGPSSEPRRNRQSDRLHPQPARALTPAPIGSRSSWPSSGRSQRRRHAPRLRGRGRQSPEDIHDGSKPSRLVHSSWSRTGH